MQELFFISRGEAAPLPLPEETLMAISLALIIILGLGADHLFDRHREILEV